MIRSGPLAETVQPEMMPIAALVAVLTDVKFHGLWRLSIIRSYRHWAGRVLRRVDCFRNYYCNRKFGR